MTSDEFPRAWKVFDECYLANLRAAVFILTIASCDKLALVIIIVFVSSSDLKTRWESSIRAEHSGKVLQTKLGAYKNKKKRRISVSPIRLPPR
ncbi:uncharacterized protein VTP21DRAFT_8837 [Calcarisporiella thermophila]|uniref:uncharacterized protein n=1 Tax=Calcarisporiella thermophila TaxID=911321 RepID=UPI0037430B1E